MSSHLLLIKLLILYSRLDEKNDNHSDDAGQRGFYDGFSETQTDSQVSLYVCIIRSLFFY